MQFNTFLGQPISAIGLGTLTWGQDTDDFEAREQIEVFIESCGTLFDTSERFNPTALTILNSGLKDRPRGSFQISLHIKISENRRKFLDTFNYLNQLLDLQRIDYLVIEPHMDLQYWPTIANELQRLYENGLVDGILFRNVPAWQSVRLQSLLPPHIYAGEHFDLSLLESQTQERIDQVQNVGKRILATTSLASGVLTGKYRSTIPADSRAASPHLQNRTQRYMTTANLGIVEAVEKAAMALGVSAASIGLAWLRLQNCVASSIIGPRTVAQLRTLLSESDFILPQAIAEALDDVRMLNQA